VASPDGQVRDTISASIATGRRARVFFAGTDPAVGGLNGRSRGAVKVLQGEYGDWEDVEEFLREETGSVFCAGYEVISTEEAAEL